MKKLLAALVVFCLMGACTTPQESQVVVSAGRVPIEQPAEQSLVLLVDGSAPTLFDAAAEEFAQKAAALTGNMLTVEVRRTASALNDYRLGEGDLVFLDSPTAASFSSDFAVLAEPMRYTDYNQFTMALNTRQMLNFLDDGLTAEGGGTTLLATFYMGTDYFVTARPLARGRVEALSARASSERDELDEGELDAYDESEEERPVAALRPGSAMAPFLYEMGLEPVVEPSLSTRIYNVTDGTVAIAELSLGELQRVDWQDSDLNLIHVGHNMTPAWLGMRSARWNALPEKYRAVLGEATACLFPVIDGTIIAQQDEQIATMREGGVSVERSFSSLRDAAKTLYARQGEPGFRKGYLLELLTTMK